MALTGKELINYLKELHGLHTSMISFVIRQGSDLGLERRKIDTEIKTAVNIKDKNNRQNVISSLKSIREKLSLYKTCPNNGLCIFSGVYCDGGKEFFEIFELSPPLPIKESTYLCDRNFHVELIEKLYDTYDDYGIVLIGGDETLFYKFHGNHYALIDRIGLCRQKKQKCGGQSAPRFSRIREGQILSYTKLIIEKLVKNFVNGDLNKLNIIGLIIAGNDMKDKLLTDEDLPYLIKSNILKSMTVNELDIVRVIHNSMDVINKNSSDFDKILDEFLEAFSRSSNNIVYGKEETFEKIREKQMKTLIITSDLYESLSDTIDKSIAHTGCKLVIINQFNKSFNTFRGLSGIGGFTWFGTYDLSQQSENIDDNLYENPI
jgi:peptide chain release factor subunit 1